jgi:hypothetical protein
MIHGGTKYPLLLAGKVVSLGEIVKKPTARYGESWLFPIIINREIKE